MNLREIEHQSIRDFVQRAADTGCFFGRILDYGCGTQPYRDIIEAAGAQYDGYDLMRFGGNVSGRNITPPWKVGYQGVLCTQVIQYVKRPPEFIRSLHVRLAKDGLLVMTYPTHWPEVEHDDFLRFTKAGMERLLREGGFEIVKHERRATVSFGQHEQVALGYGVIARA